MQNLLAAVETIRAEVCTAHPEYAATVRAIRFVFSRRMTRSGGRAISTRKIVKLSIPYFADETNFREHFRNTVLHEIAHIIARFFCGPFIKSHGSEWYTVATKIGCNGERCHTMELAEGYAQRKQAARVPVPCALCGREITLGPTQAKRARRMQAAGFAQPYRHKAC